ncbi:MAG: PIG-L family deacetylase [Magnetococcales bacterium]|nr:PIG-L family deacetylase [Magnetococcales bacterium]
MMQGPDEGLFLPWHPGQRVLFVVAHPDDLAIPAGAMVAAMTRGGILVQGLFVTSGQAGIPGVDPDEAKRIREREERHAAEILGHDPLFLGFMDGRVSAQDSALEDALRAAVARLRPDFVFTHRPDLHNDHVSVWRVMEKIAFDAMQSRERSAFRMFLLPQFYDPISWRDGALFIAVDATTLAIKRRALACYPSQLAINDFIPVELSRMIVHGYLAGTTHAEALLPWRPRYPLRPRPQSGSE